MDVGLLAATTASQLNWSVHYFPELASTNTWAKEHCEQFSNPSLVLTSKQTAGRGRGSHIWTDPRTGSNLLSSWVLPILTSPSHVSVARAGLALYRSCKTLWPALPWSLKAPNDLYIGDRKVAGLLLENIQLGEKNWLIVGLGLNILTAPALTSPPLATHLSAHMSNFTELNLKQLISTIASEMQQLHQSFNSLQHLSLSLDEQAQLLYALNQWPPLPEPYLKVQADASLQRPNGLVHWYDL